MSDPVSMIIGFVILGVFSVLAYAVYLYTDQSLEVPSWFPTFLVKLIRKQPQEWLKSQILSIGGTYNSVRSAEDPKACANLCSNTCIGFLYTSNTDCRTIKDALYISDSGLPIPDDVLKFNVLASQTPQAFRESNGYVSGILDIFDNTPGYKERYLSNLSSEYGLYIKSDKKPRTYRVKSKMSCSDPTNRGTFALTDPKCFQNGEAQTIVFNKMDGQCHLTTSSNLVPSQSPNVFAVIQYNDFEFETVTF